MKQFKAESKRLLDLMINSIYTNKEIFLRELISNASDALDKRHYLSLTNTEDKITKEDLAIQIAFDKENRTLTIADNGIGMDDKDLENNLGMIANSGSLAFKQQYQDENLNEEEIIGQFGVGFYSAFMVAKKITVLTKKVGEDQAYLWESEGEEGYRIKKAKKDDYGTTITLTIKEDGDEYDYSDFLSEYGIKNLVKKYSDYVRYPIKMEVTKTEKKEDSDEVVTTNEVETLNSMIPLWKRDKSWVSEEEYSDFYKNKFGDWNKPLKVIHTSVEGVVSYTALLFIPEKAPYDYYTKDYKKGLQLYSKGIFIMDHADKLIPEHFRFVKGLVDSQDLSLNISREMLQQDRQLTNIANRLEKKIKSELLNMLNNERETYETFWKNFGTQIKYGVYNDFGAHKELLQDLLMFYSSTEKKLVTLDEYISRMKEDQEFIYFASGESVEKIDKLPQVEVVADKGFEILYLTDEVDEFALQILGEYKEKKFKSVNQGDLNLETEEEKEALKAKAEENKDILTAIKEALGDKVSEVTFTNRLKSHAVCLSAQEGLSLEMEKVLSAMPDGQAVKANKVLEINPNHPVFQTIKASYESNPADIDMYAKVLYDQALLIEGFSIEDPIEFSNRISELIIKANQNK